MLCAWKLVTGAGYLPCGWSWCDTVLRGAGNEVDVTWDVCGVYGRGSIIEALFPVLFILGIGQAILDESCTSPIGAVCGGM